MPKLWEYGECFIPKECAGGKSTGAWNIKLKIFKTILGIHKLVNI